MSFPSRLKGLVVAAAAALLLPACGAPSDEAVAGETVRPDASAAGESPAQSGDRIAFELGFITHLDENLPEQDVYLEREPGSGEVYRVTKGDNDMDAPLYMAAVATPHDPFNDDAIGPHEKGKPLGLTLGQWLAHRGTARYEYENGTGRIQLDFAGLVPNGVYTIWHAFVALPPTTPFSGTLDLPLGARDGSTSVFVADDQGNLKVDHSFKPGLQMSDIWTTALLALNYHSDGKTYGAHPGEFGLNAHIALFATLPPRPGLNQ